MATNKKFCDLDTLKSHKKSIYYKDWIDSGLSCKVEYLTNKVKATETFEELKKRFPHNVVRLLGPSKVYRKKKYSVRIWV